MDIADFYCTDLFVLTLSLEIGSGVTIATTDMAFDNQFGAP